MPQTFIIGSKNFISTFKCVGIFNSPHSINTKKIKFTCQYFTQASNYSNNNKENDLPNDGNAVFGGHSAMQYSGNTVQCSTRVTQCNAVLRGHSAISANDGKNNCKCANYFTYI